MVTGWLVLWSLIIESVTLPKGMFNVKSASPIKLHVVEVRPDTALHDVRINNRSSVIRGEVEKVSDKQRHSEAAGSSASTLHTVSRHEVEVRPLPVPLSKLLDEDSLLEIEDLEDQFTDLLDDQGKPVRKKWCAPGYYDKWLCQRTPAPTTTPRPINCKWSPWDEWRDCSDSCGGGFKERRRYVALSAQHGGNDCVGPDAETRKCNDLVPCPVPTTTTVALVPVDESSEDKHKKEESLKMIIIISACGGFVLLVLFGTYWMLTKGPLTEAQKRAQMLGLKTNAQGDADDEFECYDDGLQPAF